MEKFTKPELLNFLCEGGAYDDASGNSPTPEDDDIIWE